MVVSPQVDVALFVNFEETVFVPDKLGFRVCAEALVAGPPEVCVVDEAFARVQDVYGNDRFDAYHGGWLLRVGFGFVLWCVAEQRHVSHGFSL